MGVNGDEINSNSLYSPTLNFPSVNARGNQTTKAVYVEVSKTTNLHWDSSADAQA